jgi:hypothetical protein
LEIVPTVFSDDNLRATEALISLRQGGTRGDIYQFRSEVFDKNCVNQLSMEITCDNFGQVFQVGQDICVVAVKMVTDECKDITRYCFEPEEPERPDLTLPEWTPIEACWQQRHWNISKFKWWEITAMIDRDQQIWPQANARVSRDPRYPWQIVHPGQPGERCCQDDFFFCNNINDELCPIECVNEPCIPPPDQPPLCCECDCPIALDLMDGYDFEVFTVDCDCVVTVGTTPAGDCPVCQEAVCVLDGTEHIYRQKVEILCEEGDGGDGGDPSCCDGVLGWNLFIDVADGISPTDGTTTCICEPLRSGLEHCLVSPCKWLRTFSEGLPCDYTGIISYNGTDQKYRVQLNHFDQLVVAYESDTGLPCPPVEEVDACDIKGWILTIDAPDGVSPTTPDFTCYCWPLREGLEHCATGRNRWTRIYSEGTPCDYLGVISYDEADQRFHLRITHFGTLIVEYESRPGIPCAEWFGTVTMFRKVEGPFSMACASWPYTASIRPSTGDLCGTPPTGLAVVLNRVEEGPAEKACTNWPTEALIVPTAGRS